MTYAGAKPSFAHEIGAAQRTLANPMLRILDKSVCRQVLQALDAPLPRRHLEIGPLSNLRAAMLTEPTVVKPVRGAFSKGVMLLAPETRVRWIDVTNGHSYPLSTIKRKLEDARETHGFPDRWIIEELLSPPEGALRMLDDIRVNAFHGTVANVMVRRRKPSGIAWFDLSMRRFDGGTHPGLYDESISPPDDLAPFIDLAVRLSSAIPLPYLRVDLYETARGPVVGELTPLPGWAHRLNPELDRTMGAYYEVAEAQLTLRGVDEVVRKNRRLRKALTVNADSITRELADFRRQRAWRTTDFVGST